MSRFKFQDIAIVGKEKKKPTEADKASYVGLEHLSSASFEVAEYGSDIAPKGEKLVMRKGDVLFGKRRAYQKKVGIAPCDGIFSAHGMVLRPNTGVVDKRFFPFFIRSDRFLDEAIRVSVGSLSPTVNWKDLKDLEFELPNIQRQAELAEVLWAMEDLRAKYRQLLVASDDIVKSRFIEQFGDPDVNPNGYMTKELGQLLLVERGGSPRPISEYLTDDEDGANWIKIGDASEGSIFITKTKEKIKKSGTSKSRHVKPGDFLLSNSMSFGRPYILDIDGYIHDGWLVLRDENNVFDTMYLYALLNGDSAKRFYQKKAAGSTVKNLNKEIVGSMPVLVPPLEEQREYAAFLAQIDKSRVALQQALDDLNAMMTSILNEELSA